MIRRSLKYLAEKRGYTVFLVDGVYEFMFPSDTKHNSLQVELWRPGMHPKLIAEFFALSKLPEPWGLIQPAPSIAKVSSAPECFERIPSWIKDCDTAHESCGHTAVSPLPTRVVDVNPSEDGQLQPFLFTSCGQVGKYAALSYVWGADLPLRTTRATLKAFESSIPWPSIPRTLQDAMVITHKLGIRYIWIDALTIIQDDESDWEREAVKMASVYGNAYITIAAIASRSCQDGIFKSRAESAQNVLVEKLDLTDGIIQPKAADSLRELEMYARELSRDNIYDQPLEKRGWALQEYMLSRRFIQYGPHGLVWECRTGHALESQPFFATQPLSSWGSLFGSSSRPIRPMLIPPQQEVKSSDFIRKLSGLWKDLVSDFSQRSLTRETDKLPAVSGLAHAFQASGMGPYHAGLWEPDLLKGLLWEAGTPSSSFYLSPREFYGQAPHFRPSRYRAPSWSWASVEGRIYWSSVVQLIKSESLDPLVVMVSNKELVLRGRIVRGRLERNSSLSHRTPANIT